MSRVVEFKRSPTHNFKTSPSERGMLGNQVRWSRPGARERAHIVGIKQFEDPQAHIQAGALIKQLWQKSDYREKVTTALKGRTFSAESREKMRQKAQARTSTPEGRARISMQRGGVQIRAERVLQRGGTLNELIHVAGLEPLQIRKFVYSQKEMPLEVRKGLLVTKKTIVEHTASENLSAVSQFAQQLLKKGLIENDIADWIRLRDLYERSGRVVPKEFSDKLRLEVFYSATHTKDPDKRKELFDAYFKLAQETGVKDKRENIRLDDEERFIIMDKNGEAVGALQDRYRGFAYTVARWNTRNPIDAERAVDLAFNYMLTMRDFPEFENGWQARDFINNVVKKVCFQSVRRDNLLKKAGEGKVATVYLEEWHSVVAPSAESIALERLEPSQPREVKPHEKVVFDALKKVENGEYSERQAAMEISAISGKSVPLVRKILSQWRTGGLTSRRLS